ncbi:hypothetical protein ACFX1X_036201 [Malus domestica]
MDLHPVQEDQQDPKPRSYWSRWSKQDFFPEPSFQNFNSYKDALSHTPPALRTASSTAPPTPSSSSSSPNRARIA